VNVAPINALGHVPYGYIADRVLQGTCTAAPQVPGAQYSCSSGRKQFGSCWRDGDAPSKAQAVCLISPWSTIVTMVVTPKLPAPAPPPPGGALPWGLETQSGYHCQLITGPPASFRGKPIDYDCDQQWLEGRGFRLVGNLDKRGRLWVTGSIRLALYGYDPGPNEVIAAVWQAAVS
jgi:hypothetical protein